MNLGERQMWKGAHEFFGQHPLSHNVGRNRTHREVCSGNNRRMASGLTPTELLTIIPFMGLSLMTSSNRLAKKSW